MAVVENLFNLYDVLMHSEMGISSFYLAEQNYKSRGDFNI